MTTKGVLRMLAAVGALICCGCGAEVIHRSTAPSGKCTLETGYIGGIRDMEGKLAVDLRCGLWPTRIYEDQSTDFHITRVETQWSPDSRLATVIACNSWGPPVRVSYDLSRSSAASKPDEQHLNEFRKAIERKYIRDDRRCDYTDPLVWVCCPGTRQK